MHKSILPPEGLSESEEDRLPMLVRVYENAGPHKLALFIGNEVAANDAVLLQETDITSTINIAVNRYLLPLSRPDGTAIRRTQIGLIDGHGNHPMHFAAAVMALYGVLDQESPGKPHYPAHKRGNVLVNCRGGRSRSLTVLALYLHWTDETRFPTLDEAIKHIRILRKMGDTHPLPGMIALAKQARTLLPELADYS
ncbi:dual specificity protein phosphatase [Brucella sp. BE17]|uniref:dual specificity protein phosphatase family protein n=1 Tax=Brucella sp. BE17 TaxID=3142977 RepID=UPI0031BB0694